MDCTPSPESIAVLEIIKTWGPIDDMSVDERRGLDLRRLRELGESPIPMETRPITLKTGEWSAKAMLARPDDSVASGLLVWLHGGGWVLGSPELSVDVVCALANASGCPVLSIDYRLAPEHPFPAGLLDCYAATQWAANHLDELGAAHGLAIGGDSAGGNLAAAVTLMARDYGGPRIDFQLLQYPVTSRDLGQVALGGLDGYGFTAHQMDWFWTKYLQRPEQGTNPYASPLLAESLEGLPPAFVQLAECDIVRDQGVEYADRLRSAHVPVEVKIYGGQLHGFVGFSRLVDAAREALRDGGRAVRAAFAETTLRH